MLHFVFKFIFLEVFSLDFSKILGMVDDFVYLYILVALLIICGLYFTIRMKFAHIRLFPDAIRYLIDKSSGTKVSSFQALMVCTASKVGTANIAGVATAIAIGGSGSIFWMWIMALIGSASSMAEATLAQMYKRKTEDGSSYIGGPAYYIDRALKNKKLGMIFAGLFLFCFLFGFNALQANNMSSSLDYYIPNYFNTFWPYIVGIIFVFLIASVILGGMKRIGFVTSYVVPIMATVYITMGLYILIANFGKLPVVFSEMIKNAFDMKAIFGGVAGSTLIIGIKRGLLSNEAGMGSAPNAAAAAETSHPVKQGVAQVLSVFIDTIMICSTSAFIVLLSNFDVLDKNNGIGIMQQAIKSQVGEWGIHFITLSVVAFAFSAIVGNSGLCESNILFLNKSDKFIKWVRIISILPIFFGCVAKPVMVWSIANIAMAGIASVNIIAIIALSGRYRTCLKDYIKQRKEGKDPVFNAPSCGINDTDLWK